MEYQDSIAVEKYDLLWLLHTKIAQAALLDYNFYGHKREVIWRSCTSWETRREKVVQGLVGSGSIMSA